ncbi:MAG: beta-ketoacyl-[acyl-carrier-protein] synthase family protein, partial [Thermodesulfovibrionia bacterium]|nr:beta-ketoacyl-[acyl-carrier-protein] synthase family protein [Thermodesulfovibrionia bacterium]
MIHDNLLITGLGVISAAGNNLTETLDSFSRGKRNAGEVSLFDTTLSYPVFEVRGFPDKYYLEGQRTLSLAFIAVEEALKDAQLDGDLSEYHVGVCMGTTVASQLNDLDFYKAYRDHGSAPMILADRYLKGNLAEFVSHKTKSKGPSLTVVNACSSGSDAIGVALS